MPVEYLVRISLPDDGWDVNMLEETCWKAGKEAAQGLFLSALEQRDQGVVALAEGDSKGKVRRYLTTRMGIIGFHRSEAPGQPQFIMIRILLKAKVYPVSSSMVNWYAASWVS